MQSRLLLGVLCLVYGLSNPVFAGERINFVGITLLDVPGGSFVMGSCKMTKAQVEENGIRHDIGLPPLKLDCGPVDPAAADEETPQHKVSIKPFQISKTEITLGQFRYYLAATGKAEVMTDEFMRYNRYGEDMPVVMVSWDDVQGFIRWLNKIEGGGFRLPTEAEWEYVCRAGKDVTYCGGDSPDYLAWYEGNSMRQIRVGQKDPNGFGVFDMSGNVWEWTQDCWQENYKGAPSDGRAVEKSNCKYRVIRGGAWSYPARDARAATRSNTVHDTRNDSLGFRLVRSR